MSRFISSLKLLSPQFWVLISFLVLVAFTGGGSRGDILSLAILRPAAVLACGYGAYCVSRTHLRGYRSLFIFAGLVVALVSIHLVPLPPSLWQQLPGRSLTVTIDRAVEVQSAWRPLTMVPEDTWNALWSLSVPLAVLLLAVQLREADHRAALWVVIGIGLVSAVLGLLQMTQGENNPFHLYRYTNGGAVGLFANRNHAALLLAVMLPVLTILSLHQAPALARRGILAASAALAFIFTISALLTASRSGLAMLALAGLGSLFLAARELKALVSNRRATRRVLAASGTMVLITVAFMIAAPQISAFDRFAESGLSGDKRFAVWPVVLEGIWTYFPNGSGIGTYAKVFQISEPHALLTPSYSNHAHNDWLEVGMTAGLPGLMLLGLASLWILVRSWRAWRGDGADMAVLRARLSSILLLMFALASISDYPLRTPLLISLGVMAAVWLGGQRATERPRSVAESKAGI